MVDMGQEKKTKGKWGPILVEARPTRVPRDGRTIMEKVQERKMKANLKSNKGNHKKPFPTFSTSEILEVAECTGARLGNDHSTKVVAAIEILNREKDRVETFDKSCQMCQDIPLDAEIKGDVLSGGGEDAPCTRVQLIVTSQDRDMSEIAGQWTKVVNKKKIKNRLPS
jgi:hypothetical protein